MKAAPRLALCGGIVPLLCIKLTIAGVDDIPEVGIGAVRPVCGYGSSQCSSSDEGVQDYIIAGLQANEQIAGGCFVALSLWLVSKILFLSIKF